MRDRYTITERLDHGGMAEVFRGVAESMEGFKKAVAIKRILPNLTKNQKFVSMFLDEARLSLFLQHANIVQVFDISKTPDNAYFLVMEYVDGCNLKTLIERSKQKNKRIDLAHSIYIMTECCKALNYAHFLEHPETNEPLGIVHRDISPPNILLSKNGEIKLVDFGLAKANTQIESTDQGVVKGKFSYLSPEAASGLEVDHRADVFAVGIILWELFTGRRLFYGEIGLPDRRARPPGARAVDRRAQPRGRARARGDRAQGARARPERSLPERRRPRRSAQPVSVLAPMKVTARDIATLVTRRAGRDDAEALRGAEGLVDRRADQRRDEQDDLARRGRRQRRARARAAEGASSLDPSAFVDTAGWAGEMGLAGVRPRTRRRRRRRRSRRRNKPRGRPRKACRTHGGGEVESLEQMLEPDRTGMHRQEGRPADAVAAIIIIVMVVLAAGAAVAVILAMK